MAVAVLIPSWNEPHDRIMSTLHSALAAGADEIVLVDDGSDEPIPFLLQVDSPEHPDTYSQIRVYRQRRSGIAAALNRARAVARSDHLAILAVGDFYAPGKLTEQHATMMSGKMRATCHDWLDGANAEERTLHPHWRTRIWTDNQFSLVTSMVEATLWDEVGGMDESLTYCMDWDFACKVERASGWHYIPMCWATAGEYEGGHTDRARSHRALSELRGKNRAEVARRYRAASREIR